MRQVNGISPQFLVETLAKSIDYYEQKLGFTTDFTYDDFYASISRNGAAIHLKCAPKLEAERSHRRSGAHVDAYFDVSGVDALHEELVGRGAEILQAPTTQPWGRRDFLALDPDGYILCFSAEA